MKIQKLQNRFWFRMFSLIIITTLLYQDVLLSQDIGVNRCLSPKSIFDKFAKCFETKGIGLATESKVKIFTGFKEISERLPKSANFYTKISEVFQKIDTDYENYIRFKKGSLKTLSEDGNSFFSIDVDLILPDGKSIPRTVVFYNLYRPPLRYLKNLCETWIEEDERCARERGFWMGLRKAEESPIIRRIKSHRYAVRMSKWIGYGKYHSRRISYIAWHKYLRNFPKIFPRIIYGFYMFFKMLFFKRFRNDYISGRLRNILIESLLDNEISAEEVKELVEQKKNKAVSSFIFLLSWFIMNEFVTAPLAAAFVLALPILIFLKIPLLLISGGSVRAIGIIITKLFLYPKLKVKKALYLTLPKYIGIPLSLSPLMKSYNINFAEEIRSKRIAKFRELTDRLVNEYNIDNSSKLRDTEIRGKLIEQLSNYGSAKKCLKLLKIMSRTKKKDKESYRKVRIYGGIIKLIRENSASLVIDFGAEKISGALVDDRYRTRSEIVRADVKRVYGIGDIEEAREAVIEQLKKTFNSVIQKAKEMNLFIDDVIVIIEGLASYKTGAIEYTSRFKPVEGIRFREIMDDIIRKGGLSARRLYIIDEGYAAVFGEHHYSFHKNEPLFYLGLNTSVRAAWLRKEDEFVSQTEFGYVYRVDYDGKKIKLNDLASRRKLTRLAERLASKSENSEIYSNFIKIYGVQGRIKLSMLRQAFENGDPFAGKVYETAAGAVGTAIEMAVSDGTVKKNDRIIIGGNLESYGLGNDALKGTFLENMRKVVEQNYPEVATRIIMSRLDNTRELKGARRYSRKQIVKEVKEPLTYGRRLNEEIGSPREIQSAV